MRATITTTPENFFLCCKEPSERFAFLFLITPTALMPPTFALFHVHPFRQFIHQTMELSGFSAKGNLKTCEWPRVDNAILVATRLSLSEDLIQSQQLVQLYHPIWQIERVFRFPWAEDDCTRGKTLKLMTSLWVSKSRHEKSLENIFNFVKWETRAWRKWSQAEPSQLPFHSSSLSVRDGARKPNEIGNALSDWFRSKQTDESEWNSFYLKLSIIFILRNGSIWTAFRCRSRFQVADEFSKRARKNVGWSSPERHFVENYEGWY